MTGRAEKRAAGTIDAAGNENGLGGCRPDGRGEERMP